MTITFIDWNTFNVTYLISLLLLNRTYHKLQNQIRSKSNQKLYMYICCNIGGITLNLQDYYYLTTIYLYYLLICKIINKISRCCKCTYKTNYRIYTCIVYIYVYIKLQYNYLYLILITYCKRSKNIYN